MGKTKTQVLEMQGIVKEFPGVRALKGVDFSLNEGEICGLLGENGAGKSTLMKVLGGIYTPEAGTIRVNGKAVHIRKPSDAAALGISFVHQELSLFPELDIATNIFAQNIPHWGPVIKNRELMRRTTELLEHVKLGHRSPTQPVKELKIGEQQLVEIARCLAMDVKLLVLDEPTSSLTASETAILFDLMRELREKGVSIIFISHRLDEISSICDKITIMRDGEHIITKPIGEISSDEIVRHMIGRSMGEMFKKSHFEPGEELLRVENLSDPHFTDINFSVHSKQIVGIYGLLGSGRTEIANAIFGLSSFKKGAVYTYGKKASIRQPKDAINAGLGLVPENRREEGLTLDHSVMENLTLVNMNAYTKKWCPFIRDMAVERQVSQGNVDTLGIKTPNLEKLAKYLSGGNQQKIVISKWINKNPRLLIMDEPTRGIDVGAKSEIYDVITKLVSDGMGVLLISSELNEVCELCDKVLVLKAGRIVGEFEGEGIQKDKLLAAAMGVKE